MVDGSRGVCWVRGCVIYFLLLVAENYVLLKHGGAGAEYYLLLGGEFFMRIRSRMFIRIRSRIIYEGPEPNLFMMIWSRILFWSRS